MTLKKFSPADGGDATVMLATTATTARAAVDRTSNAVRIVNDGASTAFLQFGDATAAATVTDMPIKAGTTEIFTKGATTHIAAICATGATTTLYFTSGEGL